MPSTTLRVELEFFAMVFVARMTQSVIEGIPKQSWGTREGLTFWGLSLLIFNPSSSFQAATNSLLSPPDPTPPLNPDS